MRSVKPLEINKKIKLLPDGIFGYVYGHQIASRYVTPLELVFQKINPTESEKRFFFKLEKISGKLNVIGYVSDEAKSVVEDLSEQDSRKLTVFPFSYNEFKNEKAFSLDEEVVIEERTVEMSDGHPISILEISKKLKTDFESQSNVLNNSIFTIVSFFRGFLAFITSPWIVTIGGGLVLLYLAKVLGL